MGDILIKPDVNKRYGYLTGSIYEGEDFVCRYNIHVQRNDVDKSVYVYEDDFEETIGYCRGNISYIELFKDGKTEFSGNPMMPTMNAYSYIYTKFMNGTFERLSSYYTEHVIELIKYYKNKSSIRLVV